MSYWQGVLNRLLTPGVLLVVIGAFLAFDAARTARVVRRLLPEREGIEEKIVAALRVAGLAIALIGAMLALGYV